MIEFLGAEDWELFLYLFVPGFVSLKVYDLLVPGKPRDFTNGALEVAAFGSFNLAAWSWLFSIINRDEVSATHPTLRAVFIFFIIFVAPAFLPVAFLSLVTPIARSTGRAPRQEAVGLRVWPPRTLLGQASPEGRTCARRKICGRVVRFVLTRSGADLCGGTVDSRW